MRAMPRNPSSSGTAGAVPLHITSSSRRAHSGASHAEASCVRDETNRIYAESQVGYNVTPVARMRDCQCTATTNTSLPLGPNCRDSVQMTHSDVLLLQFKTDGERVFHSKQPASPHHSEQPQYQVTNIIVYHYTPCPYQFFLLAFHWHSFSLASHYAQGMRHSSALPSPLMNTWLRSDNSKEQAPLFSGTSSSKTHKGSQLHLSPEQPQPPLAQRPSRAVIPKMSPPEAHAIVQNMTRELMLSHARDGSSVAATLQVMKCDVV